MISSSFAKDIYVSTIGNDLNSGTKKNPYLSFYKALDQVKKHAGSKVIFDKVLELIDNRSKSFKTILLSGHGSSGKAVLRMLTKDPLDGFPPITNTGIWMVEQQDDGTFKLKIFNDVPLSE
tara:strand:- start:257 stop:619 length:363 start_codon:yes stop_codon:yes gene_type:complete